MTRNKPPFHKLAAAAAAGTLLAAALGACKDRPDARMSDADIDDTPRQSETLAAALDDTGITAQVKGRLESDARTQAADIAVETNNGVVTLEGTAPSTAARDAAEELARMVPEVRGVDNRIDAPHPADDMADSAEAAAREAGESIDDAWITTKVKSALLADPQTQGLKIDVDTEQGVVSLSGEIDSATEHRQAVDVARGIEGVRKVDDTALVVARR
ncbi:BON domain-containing protein [Sinimarinibacterium flocculans]|uniref:BON domain-containing protein n=1 Tax=Sinimarinibacterium flocculans TaxID=985250 RepID=UPI0035115AFD